MGREVAVTNLLGNSEPYGRDGQFGPLIDLRDTLDHLNDFIPRLRRRIVVIADNHNHGCCG